MASAGRTAVRPYGPPGNGAGDGMCTRPRLWCISETRRLAALGVAAAAADEAALGVVEEGAALRAAHAGRDVLGLRLDRHRRRLQRQLVVAVGPGDRRGGGRVADAVDAGEQGQLLAEDELLLQPAEDVVHERGGRADLGVAGEAVRLEAGILHLARQAL